jgi:hypothetical protein
VRKLNETEALVTSMKADLARLQPVLEAKAAATAELLTKARLCLTGVAQFVAGACYCA